MPEYRFYTIAYDGHIKQPATSHELPNDRAANDKAKQLFDGHDIEIGREVELVLRKYAHERGVPVYGFKARAKKEVAP